MKIAYTFDTEDYVDVLKVQGDTDTGVALIIVAEDGEESCGAEVGPFDLRVFSAALLEVADRLDPPKPSLASQLDKAIRTGLVPIGTTSF